MTFDQEEAKSLITQLDKKRSELEQKIGQFRATATYLRELLDSETYDNTEDGKAQFDVDTGARLMKIVPAIDRHTNKTMSIARKNEIFDARKLEAESLLA